MSKNLISNFYVTEKGPTKLLVTLGKDINAVLALYSARLYNSRTIDFNLIFITL